MNIDYSESNKAIERLSAIDLNSSDSESEISYLLKNKIIIPFINAIVPAGIEIFRARKNQNDEEFTTKDEISYNKNLDTISLGRANREGQSIFYASHKMETSLFETSSMTKFGIDGGREVFTIGRWFVKESFLIIALIPRLDYIDKENKSFSKYIEIIEKTPFFQNADAKQHLKFFSDQFIRNVSGNDKLYKISSAYFNHCLENSQDKIYGMLFPSVKFEYRDLNLALTPEAVEKFLILDMVVKYEINISGKTGKIFPLGIGDINTFNIKK